MHDGGDVSVFAESHQDRTQHGHASVETVWHKTVVEHSLSTQLVLSSGVQFEHTLASNSFPTTTCPHFVTQSVGGPHREPLVFGGVLVLVWTPHLGRHPLTMPS